MDVSVEQVREIAWDVRWVLPDGWDTSEVGGQIVAVYNAEPSALVALHVGGFEERNGFFRCEVAPLVHWRVAPTVEQESSVAEAVDRTSDVLRYYVELMLKSVEESVEESAIAWMVLPEPYGDAEEEVEPARGCVAGGIPAYWQRGSVGLHADVEFSL